MLPDFSLFYLLTDEEFSFREKFHRGHTEVPFIPLITQFPLLLTFCFSHYSAIVLQLISQY